MTPDYLRWMTTLPVEERDRAWKDELAETTAVREAFRGQDQGKRKMIARYSPSGSRCRIEGGTSASGHHRG